MLEKDFQAKFIKKLKSEFAGKIVVVKNQAGPGVPQGFPDVSVFPMNNGFRGAIHIEFKKSSSSPYRPNQEYYLSALKQPGITRTFTAFPENESFVMSKIREIMSKNILRH